MSALDMLQQMQATASAADSDAAAGNRAIAAFLAKQPKQPTDMLRFFDRGTHYTLHGRDAHTVAGEYFRSSAAVKFASDKEADRQPYLTFNKTMGAEILRTALLDQRRRVEVYVSVSNAWKLGRRGSPGNLQAFEEECLRDSDLSADTSPVIVAVRLGRAGAARLVGVAFVDCQVHSIRVSEFEDDEHLSTLESLLCQQGARECLVPAELAEADAAGASALREMLDRCEVPSTAAKKGLFGAKEAEDDLRKLLGTTELHSRALASKERLAVSSTCALLRYLELMATKETYGLWAMDWVDAAQFMRLDAGAMRALSVEPAPGDADRNSSLLGLFSVCKTAMGARLVRKWLKQPLLSRVDLEERYDLVEAFVKGFETRALLRDEVLPKLGGDLDKLGRAFAAKKAGLKELVSLYYFVLNLPRLQQTLKQHDGRASSSEEAALIRAKFTEPLEEVYVNFTNLVRLVQAAVDLNAAQRHEYVLQSHFSNELRELAEQKDDVDERIERHHRSLCKALGDVGSELKLELDSKHGYCVKVTKKEEAKLRKHPKFARMGLSMVQTVKGHVYWNDSQLASLSEEYNGVAKQYDAEQKALVAKVIHTASTFGEVISTCHGLLAELDVLLAFAHVSSSAPEPYVRPTLVLPEDARQRIVLRGCRHPCLERMDGVGFIKNDVELVRGESCLQVVTGPNMGGKSTYIRAAGVSVLMAQIGCFVPCDEAEISLADCILARVGAGDCQSRGVSTFMAEMLETATILKSATSSSLVIIDELGRGTSTYDGFGLAWAIAEHLVGSVGCCTLFATHFHELTELASTHAQVQNRHVSAHIEEGAMTMLYKVEDGPELASFGIHVAEVADFPTRVVRAAKRKLAALESSDVIDGGDGKAAAPGTSARPAARARTALDDGERSAGLSEVRSFLEAFRQLPVDQMAAGEAQAAVASLAQKTLKASSNALVQALCQ